MDKKLEKILNDIAELSVMDLSELVKALEEKFDVKATAVAPVATVSAPGATATTPVEEKTEFDVIITNAGANKIAVIKAVREFKPELGLKEAKDMVDACPADLGTMKKDAATEAKTKLEATGAQVELK
ncbi:50S ribosomal protein L7/L12 [Candidatus Shapirobacteria bacterium CG_4_9_14_3_um_filter_36_12]|uniref:Large ribosomal subunit protein bL12 n=5 Tax=Candidatus Shapironibacteriota TaxID=1752721 RepID=A0A1J5I398_9BACT|nr:MAG: 50S ribosomal protein L7/L12 [Candidatus Shapirobacteria bacterium CG2_30_35_20]PIV07437.1 MAG: 50S ribosomal protein L7/L12 [Candidatus Shapirobacteria bacterium CG03_land_8_20_14_0_80_35_14]PJA51099.1 MAG: 50S ribosomal protein L7/L12 [Candidatus Shapirobacteria bacterium CG_4_9_14_3_um_filter_36_12]PJE67147.1 MAG: 50S ribosomal protein L7/L12 [Candidatus Shapirobacteria bacterium CG10_big_fil_rev_8_21_14_0_10_36_6]